MDDELAGCATRFALAVGHGVGIADDAAVLEGEDGACEVVAVLEAEELVLAQGFVAIDERGRAEELREVLQVGVCELRDDLDVVHIRESPEVYRQGQVGGRVPAGLLYLQLVAGGNLTPPAPGYPAAELEGSSLERYTSPVATAAPASSAISYRSRIPT